MQESQSTCDGQQARLEVVDELVGVVAKRPEVDDAPTTLHQQQLIERLQAELICKASVYVSCRNILQPAAARCDMHLSLPHT